MRRRGMIGAFGATLVALAIVGVAIAGGGLPQGSEKVKLNPADFTTKIDNPYWPMKPGNRWVYRETDTKGKVEKVVIVVTKSSKALRSVTKSLRTGNAEARQGSIVIVSPSRNIRMCN